MTEEVKIGDGETDSDLRMLSVLRVDDEETKALISAIANAVYAKIGRCQGCSEYTVRDLLEKECSVVKALGVGLGKGMKEY